MPDSKTPNPEKKRRRRRLGKGWSQKKKKKTPSKGPSAVDYCIEQNVGEQVANYLSPRIHDRDTPYHEIGDLVVVSPDQGTESTIPDEMDPLFLTPDGSCLDPSPSSSTLSANCFVLERKNEASLKVPLTPAGDKVIGELMRQAIKEYLSSRMGEVRFRQKHEWISKWRKLRYPPMSVESKNSTRTRRSKVFDHDVMQMPSTPSLDESTAGKESNLCEPSLGISWSKLRGETRPLGSSSELEDGGVSVPRKYSRECSSPVISICGHRSTRNASRSAEQVSYFENPAVESDTHIESKPLPMPVPSQIISQLDTPIEDVELLPSKVRLQDGDDFVSSRNQTAPETLNPQSCAIPSKIAGDYSANPSHLQLLHACDEPPYTLASNSIPSNSSCQSNTMAKTTCCHENHPYSNCARNPSMNSLGCQTDPIPQPEVIKESSCQMTQTTTRRPRQARTRRNSRSFPGASSQTTIPLEENSVEIGVLKATIRKLVRNPKYRSPSPQVVPRPISAVQSDCIVISSDDD